MLICGFLTMSVYSLKQADCNVDVFKTSKWILSSGGIIQIQVLECLDLSLLSFMPTFGSLKVLLKQYRPGIDFSIAWEFVHENSVELLWAYRMLKLLKPDTLAGELLSNR